MMQDNTKRMSWILRILAFVMLFTALLVILSSDFGAKYISSDEEAAGARVAKFSIDTDFTELEQSIPLQLSPGSSEEILFTVTNNSEVDVAFFAAVELEGNLPLELTVTKADTAVLEEMSILDSPMEWEDELKSNGQSLTYKMTVSWIKGAAQYEYAGGVGAIGLSVRAEQEREGGRYGAEK